MKASPTPPITRTTIRPIRPIRRIRAHFARLLPLALLLTLTACRTSAPPPRLDTSTPDWTHRTGQAAWTPARGEAEVVIDLNVWTRPPAECVLDVSKAALPFVLAHVTATTWRIDGAAGERHAAPGSPPARVGWLQLARALAGQTPAAPWHFARPDAAAWQLTNPRTGERFDGTFTP